MSMTTCNLLTLPEELIVQHILARLDFQTLKSCSLACRRLNHTIKSSVLIKYLIKLQQKNLIDNPTISYDEVPLSERLEMLNDYGKRQKIRWEMSAPVLPGQFHPESIKVDAGVIYISPLGPPHHDFMGQELHWTNLPSKKDQVIKWNIFRPSNPSVRIGSYALSIEENDLLAFATWNKSPNTLFPLQIHLIQQSTQLPYPGLTSPILGICDFTLEHEADRPFVDLAIRGTNLAVVIGHTIRYSDHFLRRVHFKLSVWNWKTGEKKCEELNLSDNDGNFVFLREDVLLLSSSDSWTRPPTLDVYQVPMSISVDGKLRLIERLGLPNLNHFHAPELSVYLTNNPTAVPSFTESSNPKVNRLFTANNLRSIIKIELVFEGSSDDSSTKFVLITHARTLLDRVDRALWRDENEQDMPTRPIRWGEWGPDATRMFWDHRDLDSGDTEAICGSRLFVLRGRFIRVFDFGPENDTNGRILGPEESLQLSDLGWRPEEGGKPAGQDKWFQDVVHTKLPFDHHTLLGSTDGIDVRDWDACVYVDQSRIVGLVHWDDERIDVLYLR